MNTRLTGEAYRKYWTDRMAKGAHEASFGGAKGDVDPQADAFFAAICKEIPEEFAPTWVLEIGSGYGRILKKLRWKFPMAALIGVELAEAAVKGSWSDENTKIFRGDRIPSSVGHVDLAVTCTALQHMTDEPTFIEMCSGIQNSIRPGGRIVCLENIRATTANHMRGHGTDGYLRAFGAISWSPVVRVVDWKGEMHAVMSGEKKQ